MDRTTKELNMQEQIDELKRKIEALENVTTIPFEVEQALRERLGIQYYSTIQADSKSASSENQSINEGGVATYSVMKPPDGFVKTIINGSTVYLPYFT